jgi:hypothetical protein
LNEENLRLLFSILFISILFISLYINLYKKIKKINNQENNFVDKITEYNKDQFQTTIMVLNLILDNYFNLFMRQKKSYLSKKNDSTAILNWQVK